MQAMEAPVSAEARKALWGSAIGYAMDGFDLLILGFMLRAISAELNLGQAEAASLVTGTLVGAVLGGLLFGMLSDRLGRVRVLTWTILLFAVFTGLSAFAQGYWDLAVYRTTTGDWWINGVTHSTYGLTTDLPAPGDYDGNGSADIAVWRPSTGEWHVRSEFVQRWGYPNDLRE